MEAVQAIASIGNLNLSMHMARSLDQSASENPEPTKKPSIHPSMVKQVQGWLQEQVKDGRKSAQHRPSRSFHLMSPFVVAPIKKGDEVKTSQVHPFWSVTRCKHSKPVNNIKLIHEQYVVGQTAFK